MIPLKSRHFKVNIFFWQLLFKYDNFCDVLYEWSDELREVEELTGEGAVVANQCQNEGTVVTMYDLQNEIC